MKRIGIVGSRRRNSAQDAKLLDDRFKARAELYKWDVLIVSGGCKEGGDHFAELMAKHYGVPIWIYYPRKHDLRDDNKFEWTKINFDRNTEIAKDSEELFALVADDRTGGTEDTIKKFIYFHGKDSLFLL